MVDYLTYLCIIPYIDKKCTIFLKNINIYGFCYNSQFDISASMCIINKERGVLMPKTIPMIITNDTILVKEKEGDKFLSFEMPGIEPEVNIPFYHEFAKRISECQYYFKEFIKNEYGKKYSKNVFAIIIPDDTSALESIFINEFFLNSGACKAVAKMTMGQAISKNHNRYITISKTQRNVVLQYINNDDIMAQKLYDFSDYNVKQIFEDAKRLHIDVEYSGVPIFVNNINMNMDDFFDLGEVISPKQFMDKIAQIDVEKI